ncbi:MAG: sporulation protein [Clostridiales bacterium]|nr:sporulation protein [Clostridiales bacterium]
MARVLSNHRCRDFLTAIGLLLAVLSLVLYPAEAVEAARSGLELCLNVIIPSLFPFFVLSSLCVDLGLIRHLGRLLEPVMYPLFRVNGSCSAAFALGIIGGYPVGAKTAISLYEKQYCTKAEAERMLSFCNNSGPAFILGVVGAGVFSSGTIGMMLYCMHVLASILIGIGSGLFAGRGAGARTVRRAPTRIEAVSFTEAFTSSVKNSFFSTLAICGFVIFFTVVIRMLFLTGVLRVAASGLALLLGPLGMTEAWAERLLTGFIEMSSGVWSLQSVAGSLTGKLSLAAFILGWAGVSVHFQVLSFIGKSGLSTRTYILGKFLHGVLSAALMFLACRFFPVTGSVPAYYAEQISNLAGLDFSTALTVSCAAALVIWVVLLAISVVIMGRTTGKKKRSVV